MDEQRGAHSHILMLQLAFERYRQANIKYWQSRFINNDGRLCTIGDYDSELQAAENEYHKALEKYWQWQKEHSKGGDV